MARSGSRFRCRAKPSRFLRAQVHSSQAWSAATLEFTPETDGGPIRDRLRSCSKNQRQLLWLLVRVIPDLFGEILPDIQHVKRELEPSRSTGAFAVRRPLQATAAAQASSYVKSQPVPATSTVQASSSLESQPVPAISAVQASSSTKSEQPPAIAAASLWTRKAGVRGVLRGSRHTVSAAIRPGAGPGLLRAV